MSDSNGNGRSILFACFSIRDASFAFDASAVQEVIRPRALTVVPHAPDAVLGVINLRGRIVTVFDAGELLGYGPSHTTPASRICMVELGAETVGLLIDRMDEVTELDECMVEPLPPGAPPAQARMFRGVFRSVSRLVSWLEPHAMVSVAAAERAD